MKLSKRERVLLVIVALLALGAVYYFYFLNPFLSEMKGIKTDTEAKQVELQTLTLQHNQLVLLDQQIADLHKQNAGMLEKIPTGFDQPELLYSLTQTLEKNAEKISYVFVPPAASEKLFTTSATIQFYTNYDKLKLILQAFKNSSLNNRILTLSVNTETKALVSEPEPKETDTGEEKKEDKAAANDTEDTNKENDEDTDKEKDTEKDKDTKKEEDKKTEYELKVVMVLEFFSLKGETGKAIPAWNTFEKGKTNLFS